MPNFGQNKQKDKKKKMHTKIKFRITHSLERIPLNKFSYRN